MSVTVESELGYTIFHTSEHQNVRYYAPRATMMGTKRELTQLDTFTKFSLNERLLIRVSGPKNKEIKLIFRFE